MPASPVPPTWLVRAVRVVAHHRLAHFAVLGAVLFAVAPGEPSGDPPIRLTQARLDALAARAAARERSPVTPALTTQVRSQAIEDELLVREAQRLGLDRGDDIIRARLVQKMLFLAEDLAGATRPATEDELRAFFASRSDAYIQLARVRFVHVFAPSADALAAIRKDVIAWADAHPGEIPPFGRGFAVSRRADFTVRDLARAWGEPFAMTVAQLAPGTWSEPIASVHGAHLVLVERSEPDRPARFEDVRDRLALDLQIERRRVAISTFIEVAAERYTITIDGAPVTAIGSTGRTAARTEPSVED